MLDRQFEADVHQSLAECAAILLRLGGAIQSYAVRQQDEHTKLWFPIKVVFKWQSFVPGVRAPQPAAEPQPAAPEPEPVVEMEPEMAAEMTQPEEDPDGTVMVGPGGERRSVPPDELQEYMRAGWRLLADIEDEGADA
jgi:hypothetical protein